MRLKAMYGLQNRKRYELLRAKMYEYGLKAYDLDGELQNRKRYELLRAAELELGAVRVLAIELQNRKRYELLRASLLCAHR